MSKKCARCEKTVYPAEELKCFDKSWHKQCFKCNECNMTLTLKNCKGYNKTPYCNAHYPQLSATVVADTPENRRIQTTTKMQSQAKYHEDFINNIRGTVTSVAEDNEMKRAKEVGNVVSQAAYRGQGNSERGSTSGAEPNYTRPMRSYTEEEDTGYQPPQTRMLPMGGGPAAPPPQQPPVQSSAPAYMAMYDYEAQDDDEVAFNENDKVLDVETVDEGWVIGTIERTGQRGMIPANYIEQC